MIICYAKYMLFNVYIIQCADGSYYIGYTNNIAKRIHQHNNTKFGAKYTRTRRPVVLKYIEEYPSLNMALSRECELKKLSHLEKKILISIQCTQ